MMAIAVDSSGQKRRQKAEKQGRKAEARAAVWLIMAGYKILDRRVKTPVGEVDLIARKGRTIVAVEVKQRGALGLAKQAATPERDWQRRQKALQFWVKGKEFKDQGGRFDPSLRFDAIMIVPWRMPVHIQSAWRPDV